METKMQVKIGAQIQYIHGYPCNAERDIDTGKDRNTDTDNNKHQIRWMQIKIETQKQVQVHNQIQAQIFKNSYIQRHKYRNR